MPIAVDTTTVAPSERFSMWHEAAGRCFFPLDLEQLGPGPFSGRLIRHELVSIDAFQVIADPNVCRRTAAGVADADPEQFQLHLLRRGRCAVRQEDRSDVLTPGTMTTLDSSRGYELEAREPFELVVFGVPKVLVRPFESTLRRSTATAIDGRSGIGGLVVSYLDLLVTQLEGTAVSRSRGPLAETVLALLRALALERTGEASLGPAPLLLERITGHIERNLADPALTPTSIAATHFISTRYLHKLFRGEEHSVAETIRRARMERCRRDLGDPALAGETIAAIALRWGMPDAAHFSRLFRAEYGCAPREYRVLLGTPAHPGCTLPPRD